MAKQLEHSQTRTESIIESHEPVVKINYRALTKAEQSILTIVANATTVQTVYQIYMKYVYYGFASQYIKQIKKDDEDLTTNDKKNIEKEFRKLFKKSNNHVGMFAQYLNKKYSIQLSSFKTITRMCNDFYGVGWFGHRKIRNKTSYFLNDNVLDQLTMEKIKLFYCFICHCKPLNRLEHRLYIKVCFFLYVNRNVYIL